MTSHAFVTDLGVRVPAITTDQMREIDRVAIEELGPNLYQMMENAVRNLAVTVLETLGAAWSETAITVLCGTGGNGGGGICAARHLANRGADVTVVVSDPGGLTPVPSEQLAIYRATTGESFGPQVPAAITLTLALPKTGLDAETSGDLWLADLGIPAEVYCRVGIDVPTGLFGDRFRARLRPFGV